MQRIWYLVIGVVLCVVATGKAAATEDTYTLHGKVVSSVDGSPIRGALVQLTGSTNGNVLSGNDGNFTFQKLTAGEYSVSARKPGYFASEHGEALMPIVARVQVSANTPELALPLIPEGVIYGRITDEKGEPIEGVLVEGRPRYRRAGQANEGPGYAATTNESGEYRVVGLPPGSYYLLETPKAAASEELIRPQSLQRVTTGIPVSFYPGVQAPGPASLLKVSAGSLQQIDWRIARQPLYQVAGRVQLKETAGSVMVALIGCYSEQPFAILTPGADGTFIFPSVAPGEYIVAGAQSDNQTGQNLQLGMKLITVNANVQGIFLQVLPGALKPVHFREELTHRTAAGLTEQPIPANVSFLRVDLPDQLASSLADRPSQWNNETRELGVLLEPGTYRIVIYARPKLYAASARSGGTDLLREDLVVAPGSDTGPIDVVLRDDAASVTGKVRADRRAVAGRVVLLPESKPREAAAISTEGDGSFQFQGLAPGRYFLLAVKSGTEMDLDNPETVRRIQILGDSVDLQADGVASVDLEMKKWEE